MVFCEVYRFWAFYILSERKKQNGVFSRIFREPIGMVRKWRHTWHNATHSQGVCEAAWCTARRLVAIITVPKARVSFFDFPKDKSQWILKVKRKNWRPSRHAILCSEHFEEGAFVQSPSFLESLGLTAGKLRLKPGALPSKFAYDKPAEVHSHRGAYEKRRRQEVRTRDRVSFWTLPWLPLRSSSSFTK